MAKHNSLGKLGEKLGAAYISEKGFKILFRNWRYKHLEIDIIASKNNVLHFVEVKARHSERFGYPEEAVDAQKIKNLTRAATAFLFQHDEWKQIQFDILSIIIRDKDKQEYFFIEDIDLT